MRNEKDFVREDVTFDEPPTHNRIEVAVYLDGNCRRGMVNIEDAANRSDAYGQVVGWVARSLVEADEDD